MRSRSLKPGFFKNEELAALDPFARLLFEGLWCLADREGRLEDRPRRIKVDILPYDDVVGERLLAELDAAGFILRYTAQDGRRYIQIVNFLRHQQPHYKELASEIPPPEGWADLARSPVSTRGYADLRSAPDDAKHALSTVNGQATVTASSNDRRASVGQPSANHRPTKSLHDTPEPGTRNLVTGTRKPVTGGMGGNSAAAPAAPHKEKRKTVVDDAFRERMRQQFALELRGADDVDEQINLALGHKKADRYTDLQAYVRNWLRNAVDWRGQQRQNGAAPVSSNGHHEANNDQYGPPDKPYNRNGIWYSEDEIEGVLDAEEQQAQLEAHATP